MSSSINARTWTEETEFLKADCPYCGTENVVSLDESGEFPVEICLHYYEAIWRDGRIVFLA